MVVIDHHENVRMSAQASALSLGPQLLRPEYDANIVNRNSRPADYETWLDVRVKDVESLQQLLRPFPAEEMEAVQVGTHVNSARNEGPLCLAS
jgi:putative SOS response-associated peptidase YedK